MLAERFQALNPDAEDALVEIKQGTAPTGDSYHCQRGGGQGHLDNKATFEKAANLASAAQLTEVEQSQAARQVMLASTKTVDIEIALPDLQQLKASNYKLCFAKKVAEGEYNVVWQSYLDYLAFNKFSWTPQYQLFGSNIFQSNVEVRVATNLVDIGLGEESTLNEFGILSAPSTGGPATSVNMNNEFGSIHPGVNQLSTGIHGEQISTPIYVAPSAAVKGHINLTPVEKVLVWFEQNIQTGAMFSSARSLSIEIDLTGQNSATRLYENQGWVTP
ncbi:MAG: hypothetical protein AAF639_37730 [Chloroflexota bacterium]